MNLGAALVSSCVQLLWPAHCAGCDVLLHSDDAVFCGACAHLVNPIGLTCAGCALPEIVHADGSAEIRCAGCARRDFAFSRAYAGFEYGAAIASAIVRMKHGGRPDLARRLGRIMQDALLRALGPAGGPPIDAVLPVPLHPRKLRRRGFNQALELARVALTRLGLRGSVRYPARKIEGKNDQKNDQKNDRKNEIRNGSRNGGGPNALGGIVLPALERSLLLRIRHTRELGRSGPGARRIEVFGAFSVSDPARVAGRRFLVVDDVMTTGATLNECAETLMRAGAAEVRVVALARAL